jgi:hypothetical protein
VAGGLFSATVGPQIVRPAAEPKAVPFPGTYPAVNARIAAGVLLSAFPDFPRSSGVRRPDRGQPLENVVITAHRIAIICFTVGSALMNLTSPSSRMAMAGCGFQTADAASGVSGHMTAICAPSSFTGANIARLSAGRVVGPDLAIIAAWGAVKPGGADLGHFFMAMIPLRIGCNPGFFGVPRCLRPITSPPNESVSGA